MSRSSWKSTSTSCRWTSRVLAFANMSSWTPWCQEPHWYRRRSSMSWSVLVVERKLSCVEKYCPYRSFLTISAGFSNSAFNLKPISRQILISDLINIMKYKWVIITAQSILLQSEWLILPKNYCNRTQLPFFFRVTA